MHDMFRIIAMMTIFGVGFQLGWAPLSHVVAAEVPTNRLRDLTYALGSVFNIAIQFAVSFSIPYLLFKPRNLGPKIGYIFCVTSVISLLFAYFCIPECRGKTLEEIDLLFQKPTREIVAENWANTKQTTKDIMTGNFKRAFTFQQRRKSIFEGAA